MSTLPSDPKSILITGASSGIGTALALAYAELGTQLALCGRNPERLAEVTRQCRKKGATVTEKILDIQDRFACAEWIAEIDGIRPLDLLIANAGISSGTHPDVSEEDQVRDIFAVNLAGTLNTVLPVIELMKMRQRGQIALISSMAGFRGMPSAPAYSASKAAIRSYGEGLRGRLVDDGIKVSVICPGFVKSRITDANDFPMPFLMEAGKAALVIRKGLRKNKARISFPWQMYLLTRLISAIPQDWIDRFLNRAAQKV